MNKKIKIALVSQEKIGKDMAGAAIRYFEIAKILANYSDVTLFSPQETDLKDDSLKFEIKTYIKSTYNSFINNLELYDYVLAQELSPDLLGDIKRKKIKFISDLYDPLPIEISEHMRNENFLKRSLTEIFTYNSFLLQIATADCILCSNDRQLKLYKDMAKKAKIDINNKKIIILSFGLNDKEPHYTDKNMIYDLFPSIGPDDKIILWGGGIWNWFDALSVVKAIEKIYKIRKDVKLVFLGAKNKNFNKLQDNNLQNILNYCQKNNLENHCVFLNYNWVPYTDRVNFLLSAKICISTHFKNEETYYSYRTRILDYFWTNKPTICTEGDVFSELIKQNNLGKVVRYENVDDIVNAILELLDRSDLYKIIEDNIEKFKVNFTWSKVTKELVSEIQTNSIEFQNLELQKFNKLKFRYFFWGFSKKIINKIIHE